MKLRNTHEPFDIVEDSNEDRIAFLMRHGYVEVGSSLDGMGIYDNAFMVEHAKLVKESKRGKKEQPPTDLSVLADEISRDEDAG